MKLSEIEIGNNPVQCGCCDFYSLKQRGKCLICPVCFWEDDCDCIDGDWLKLGVKSDLNDDLTLAETRRNFKQFGAWHEKWINAVISEKERGLLKYMPRNV